MTTVPVLLFASYADAIGSSKVEIPVDQAQTVSDLVHYLRSLPGGEKLPAKPVVAVNLNQVDLDYRPVPGDEVAILPPMAGG